jgi:hypothetical protein
MQSVPQDTNSREKDWVGLGEALSVRPSAYP